MSSIRLDECHGIQVFTADWKRIAFIDLRELDLTDKEGNPTDLIRVSFDTFFDDKHKRRFMADVKPPEKS